MQRSLKNHLKQSSIRLFLFAPVRFLTRAIIAVFSGVARLAAQARFRALVPGAGPNSMCHSSATLKYPSHLDIGDFVWIGQHVCIGAHSQVTIEDYVRVSRGVVIETAGVDFTASPPYPHTSRPITIKKGAWLATNAVILGGVTIGEYAVIGAGAVVTHDVDAHTVVAPSAGRRVTFAHKPVAA